MQALRIPRLPRQAVLAIPAPVRDAGWIGVSILAVGAVYAATSSTGQLAAAGAIALSTAAGMHTRLAIGPRHAAAQVVGSAAFLLFLGAPLRLGAVLLVTGLCGAAFVARRTGRSAIPAVSGSTAAVAALCATVAAVLASLPWQAVADETLAASLGGLLSASLILMLGPVAQALFGQVSRFTMIDWLSYDHPLLRRLAADAPGTFQHSVNVGVLADAAATAIGADSLLARLGGLYHDVGKVNAPEYFAENQHALNPHDALDPAESARIFQAHVSDGVALLKAHHMGERLEDCVREHHGSGEMRSLQTRAEALGRTGERFHYVGPPPRSRETGLLMIADQVEATARSSPPPDEASCREIVRVTMARIRLERQLEDSGLTFEDLQLAERGFSRALEAMYHRRPQYPPQGSADARPRPRLVFPRRAGRRIAS